MNILFIHPNMPGQYKHLAAAFAKNSEHRVVFITRRKNVTMEGILKVQYAPPREPAKETHRYLQTTERAVLQGQQVWRACHRLKTEKQFVPDVIVAHPGWGDTLFIKDIFPDAPLLSYFEFYYHTEGADVGFDPKEKIVEDDRARIRAKNIVNLLNLEAADWGISPTHWQATRHPKPFLSKISVLHDGIDTDLLRPDENAQFTLPSGKILKSQDEVVTYVARNFEPYRGFPTFMQAAEIILKNRPRAHIIAVGADDVSYGKRPPTGMTYRDLWTKQVALDPERMHFTGALPYSDYIKILQLSSAHIYLTYPFVLSWSMLEAMSVGCVMIASDTAPVQEVIVDGQNGWMVDFFSAKDVAAKVEKALENRARMEPIRRAARETVLTQYNLKDLLPKHMQLVEDVASRRLPR